MPIRDLTSYLGQVVQVVIDRPLGSLHPRHPDICYPINYGFLPGTISGDGAPIDVYVLGVDTPVETYQGVVIAVVAREDDVEDKLVVAPRDFSREEIAQAVTFQEQFFTSTIVTAPSSAENSHAPSTHS